jgi:hypothetical protein
MPFRTTLAFTVALLAAAPALAQDTTATPTAPRPDSVLRRDSLRVPKDTADSASRPRRRSGEPVWPVPGPEPLPGSILPAKRIVAYYGTPASRRMGILGELQPDSMLARLDREVERWQRADTLTPVQPALHLIAVVAQAAPGADGKYRARTSDAIVEKVARWAESRNAIVFLDVQLGLSTVQQELPRLAKYLKRPNFHLGLDPEFAMHNGAKPGSRIGRLDAKDINYATKFLAELVEAESLPPKVLVVHRFRREMVGHAREIELDPRVQIVIDMDGWGTPKMKRDTYKAFVWSEPVQYTGFKLFYKNDRRLKGSRLMTPEEVLALTPKPLYIQYQ